jgi:autotransporter-associated beta strand protein
MSYSTLLRAIGLSRIEGRRARRAFDVRLALEEFEPRLTPATPSVMAINRMTPAAQFTNVSSVVYSVAFDQAVTGVDAGDFRVVADTTVSFNSSITVAGSGDTYTASIDGLRGSGALRLALIDDDSISTAGGPLGGVGMGNGSFQGQPYGVMPSTAGNAPYVQSISLSSPATRITDAATLVFAVSFSEPVTAVDALDFRLATTGSAQGTLSQIAAAGPSGYTVTVSNVSGIGHIELDLVDNASIRDADGNALANHAATFANATTLTVGSQPTLVATADVDGDGRVDLIASNTNSKSLSILLGNGDGTFKPQTTFSTPQKAENVVVADVNGDGRIDALSFDIATASISLFLGNGNGTFKPGLTTAAISPRALAVADVNGDGKVDLLIAESPTPGSAGVKLGNGDGTFAPEVTYTAGSYANGIAAADVNGDGVLDLAVANKSSASVSLFLGNGYGTFQAQKTVAVSTNPQLIGVSDLNDDGKPDVVVANSGSANVGVLLGCGNGNFKFQSTYATLTNPSGGKIADFNRDGIADIAVANTGSNSVSVLLGNGNGTFKPQMTLAMASQTRTVAVADLNADGQPDLVAANAGTSLLSVLLLANGGIVGPSYFESPLSPTAAPYVVSLNAASSPTNATSVAYTAVFSKSVTGVDASDFALQTTGSIQTAAPLVVAGSGASYTVTINGIAGDGTLGLNLIDDGSIRDADQQVLRSLTPAFSNYVTYSTSSDPLDVAAADLNGDNKPDLVTANHDGRSLSVILGYGDGTLYQPVLIPLLNQTFAVELADFNQDGKVDIVAAGANASVLFGNGNGTFQAPLVVSGVFAGLVELADINADGFVDIVTTNNGAIAVVLSNGNGTFRPEIDTTANLADLTVADFNADGKLDIAYINGVPRSVVILLGNGNGTFQSKATYSLPGFGADVAAADMNSDGQVDVVFTAGNNLGVLYGNGDGAFGNMTILVPPPPGGAQLNLGKPRIADVDRDGRRDLVFRSNGITLALGNGDGSYRPFSSVAQVWAENAAIVADVNGDGRLDLVGVENKSETVGIVLGLASNFSGQGMTLDQTAPTATLVTTPTATVNGLSATFGFTGSDPAAGGVASGLNRFEYQLDGGAFVAAASSLTLTNLSEGNHTFRVRAVDNAGNVGPAASYAWQVDLTTRVQAIDRFNPTYALTGAANVTYQVTFNLPVSGVDAADFTVSLSGVTVTPPIVVVPVSSSVYNVTVSGIAGSGTLALGALDDGTIRDVQGLPLSPMNLVVTGPAYIINRIDPLATLSVSTIAENSAVGATIGSLSANDPSAGGAFTFGLPSSLADNAAFTISGNVLKAAATFDFESKSSYSVTVRVTHTSGLSYDKNFTIVVGNIVETATVYVDAGWANLSNGSIIADADPSRAGDQPATIGVDAFATLSAATAAIDAGGTGRIVLADGTYAGNFALDRPMAFDVAGAATVSGIISGGNPLVKRGLGILTLTGANAYTGGTTIDAGTLQIGNGGVTGSIAGNVATNGVLTFNRSDTVTFAGVISGFGAVLKAGSGALALGAANSFQGGVTVNRGTLLVSSNDQLGASGGIVNVVSPGRLTVTGDVTSSRQYFLHNATLQINAGVTLTLTNAELNGGFLSGPGTIKTMAGAEFSTTFAGSISQTSVSIDARGADKFVAFTDSGAIALSNQATTTLDGFNNSSFGRLAINGVARVRDFNTLGQMTVGGLVDNIGASDLGFGGVTTISAGGVIDLKAVNALIAGGLVNNNGAFGSSSNTIRVDFDGFLKGAGAFGNVETQNGGVYAPGNSPGGASTNQYNLNGGGVLEFEVSNAMGVAGNQSGWDLIAVRPTMFNPLASVVSLSATPGNRYTIRLTSRLDSGDRTTSGPAVHFDPAQAYAWKFADIDGAGVLGTFDPAAFAIDASAFRNAFTGAFGVELRDGGKSLNLVYVPTSTTTATTTTLLATPNATTGGDLVTFTATVNPNPGNRGAVNFLDGNAAIIGGEHVALVDGLATFQTSVLATGSHTIRADYSGAEGLRLARPLPSISASPRRRRNS